MRSIVSALIRAGRQDLVDVLAETTPLPSTFHDNEPGLLTVEEFLRLRNPRGKRHAADTYETTVETLNYDGMSHVGRARRDHGDEYDVYRNKRGFFLKRHGDVVGVIHRGVLYHQKNVRLPEGFIEYRRDWRSFDIKQKKVVKYPVEFTRLVSDMARLNLKQYPELLQNLRSEGESFQLRSEKKLAPDKGITLAILNSAGLRVAAATNEWGTTLIRVAREYQRRGFGKLLAKLWYRWNPSFPSGGFTPQGERNAVRTWEDRVHEFLSRGWYSQLVRERRISKDRVDDILRGLTKRPPRQSKPPKPKARPLIMLDFPTFVVYDEAFYRDPSEQHLYGYGFYRSGHVGDYLFRIDYDRRYADLTTRVALHAAHVGGIERIYVGEGYGDLIEYQDLTQRIGDYILPRRDARIDKIAKLERQIRRKLDPYRETYALLLETADSKW